jgi:hypothetical protein
VVNASLTASGTRDPLLQSRAALERRRLDRVHDELASRTWLVPWQVEPNHWRGPLGHADAHIGDSRRTAAKRV